MAILFGRLTWTLRVQQHRRTVRLCLPFAALFRQHIVAARSIPFRRRLEVTIVADTAALHVRHQLIPHQIDGVRLTVAIVVSDDRRTQKVARLDACLPFGAQCDWI